MCCIFVLPCFGELKLYIAKIVGKAYTGSLRTKLENFRLNKTHEQTTVNCHRSCVKSFVVNKQVRVENFKYIVLARGR